MRAMPAVPIEVLPYVRGIQLVLSSYEGYTKGKRREADKLIRDEIKRAGTRARNHISNIQDLAFKANNMPLAKVAKLAASEIDSMIVNWLSERCLVTQAANNFVLFQS